MVKDFIAPQLQMYCPILVQTQYHKSDHIWFSFSRKMRYDFYEGVLMTPIIPMHWVKVSVVCFVMTLIIKYIGKEFRNYMWIHCKINFILLSMSGL